jgi:hypothetical protein
VNLFFRRQHFFFVADVISAILLYRSAKKGKKHIS